MQERLAKRFEIAGSPGPARARSGGRLGRFQALAFPGFCAIVLS
jgi:hypothetical protein